jgi:glycosyltransferase involved in cell wall biosynthesis
MVLKYKLETVEMLSEKLGLLIHDKQLRIKMGKNSRKLFEKEFTLDKVVNQTFELYDKLLKT